MPKFMFLHALAYVTEKKPEEFQATLKSLLELYPETDITPLASSYLKQLARGRELQSSGSNMRGMLWDLRLTNDSTLTGDPDAPAQFELNPDNEQYLVLLFPTDTVSSNQLLFDIARHNFTSFVVKDFDLEQMNFGRLGLLIIKGFSNMNELNHYRRVMADDTKLQIPRQVRPVIISAKNFETLIKEGRSFEEYFRYLDEQNYREAQENVLPPEVFGEPETLKEAEEAPAPTESSVDDVKQTLSTGSEDSDGEKNEVPAPVAPAKTEPQAPVKPTAPKPALPEYPEGSEGDDPLFDNP